MTPNHLTPYAIAIDGPMGVGKSTVAKLLAHMLDITYIDTGAMYRAVAYYCVQNHIDLSTPEALEAALAHIEVQLRQEAGVHRVFLNGADITDHIRTQEISAITSQKVAVNQKVREFLVQQQRHMATTTSVVMDGRDIASHVLPNAQLKIYLDAHPEIRAKRRALELENKGQTVDFKQILSDTITRDHIDKTRLISPLTQVPDAIPIDTGDLSPQTVAEKITMLAKEVLSCFTTKSKA